MKKRLIKKYKKQKAFTLIELLAVILILGIIALIAIPTVNSVIEQSRRGAFETTVRSLEEVIERTCTMEMLEGKTITKVYKLSSGKISPEVDIKGSLPDTGIIFVNDKCDVEINVATNKNIAVKGFEDDDISVVVPSEYGFTYVAPSENDTHLGILYIDPTNIKTKCDSTNAVSTTLTKSGCMKFFVFKKNDDGTYNAILDHNTSVGTHWSDENTSFKREDDYYIYTSRPIEMMNALKSDTSSWNAIPTRSDVYNINKDWTIYTLDYNGYRAFIPSYYDMVGILGMSYNSQEDDASYGEICFDENATNNKYHTWLYDNQAWITSTGYPGLHDDDALYNDNYVLGYWLSTTSTRTSTSSWFMSRNCLRKMSYTYSGGIRPAITIPGYYID